MTRIETSIPNFDQGHTTMDSLQAELARSVYMDPTDRSVLVGAVMLDAAVIFDSEPGLGKTTIAKATAEALGGTFGRVQGAPDLLPGDITGTESYDPRNGDFKFHRGPVFSNVLLADEISRTAPRTQSALLEAMQERQVTVNGTTYQLPKPFVVLATKNPNEIGQGTYPLTLANLDRFAVGIGLNALNDQERIAIRSLVKTGHATEQVVDAEQMHRAKTAIDQMPETTEMYNRVNRIITAMREIDKVDLGASVLGGERPFGHIIDIAKTQAMLENMQMVDDRHIDVAAEFVLPHRMQVTYEAEEQGITPRQLVHEATSRLWI